MRMTPEEKAIWLAEAGMTLKAHYRATTEADAELLFDRCGGFPAERVSRAIKDYRAAGNLSANIDKIRAICARAGEPQQQGRRPVTRIIDWLHDESHRTRTMEPSDAIHQHFTEAWAAVHADPTADEYGSQFARQMILVHARMAFVEIGIGKADADEWARAIVGLEPGEKLKLEPMIHSAEYDNPQPYEQIKELAKAARSAEEQVPA